jgi:hypothetical protein
MSNHPNDGGPAFPSAGILTPDGIAYEGMSLRDHFAAAALQGFLASESGNIERLAELTGYIGSSAARISAQTAYIYADAMLAARDGKEQA